MVSVRRVIVALTLLVGWGKFGLCSRWTMSGEAIDRGLPVIQRSRLQGCGFCPSVRGDVKTERQPLAGPVPPGWRRSLDSPPGQADKLFVGEVAT